ncbi:hypothetical protein R3P38DRAFT_3004847 [Favolaschia claudopus]|uniref:RRM domain-containing protein n=1 Tax=Favolaschia claudopus TaxID=2862362 RepID=A0AAW0AJQ6_9AGAR
MNVALLSRSNPPSLSPEVASCHPTVVLWTGLEPWMDVEYAHQVCALMGWQASVCVPPTSLSTSMVANNAGFCLLVFPDAIQGRKAVAQVHGDAPISMPNSSQNFTLSWAGPILPSRLKNITGTGNQNLTVESRAMLPSLFVTDLDPGTSQSDLMEVFQNPILGLLPDRPRKYVRPFKTCHSAKIMVDYDTGMSRGFGFIRFGDTAEQLRALSEMQGLYCQGRPMRLAPATPKVIYGSDRQMTQHLSTPASPSSIHIPPPPDHDALAADPYNTTLFVGGLSRSTDQPRLKMAFQPFGPLHYVKVNQERCYGFVQFMHKLDAEHAFQQMQGAQMDDRHLRLSWGRGFRKFIL